MPAFLLCHLSGSFICRILWQLLRFNRQFWRNYSILYGFHSVLENWFPQITEWNYQFRKWFESRGNSTEIATIVKQVDLMGWTEDGHFNIALRDVLKRNELLEAISKLAIEKSLTPIIEHKRA
jgi:hypothetical protein